MSHTSYNPFNDDHEPYPCSPRPGASQETSDDIERYRRIRSMNSSRSKSPRQQRQPSPLRRQAADPHPSITTMLGRAGLDDRPRQKRQSSPNERRQRRAERIYKDENVRVGKYGRSRRETAAASAAPMLSQPLMKKEFLVVPTKSTAESIKLQKEKQLQERRQLQATSAQAASGNRGLWSILWLLFISATAGYYYGKHGLGSVGPYLEQAMSAIADYRPSYEKFLEESQFNMTDPDQANKWPNSNSGLEMTMQFAADAKWYKYFVNAVADWNNSSSLSLTMENVTVDPDCTPVDGVIKFCNKDWGDTGWNGINYAMTDSDGYIVSSVANMNEYYLKWSVFGDAQKQYVACHEIGHGFGLPHSDENFYNRDQGTCMDYSINPRANMHPNGDNYDYLYALYGSFDDSSTTAPTVSPSAFATAAPTIASTIEATTANRRLGVQSTSQKHRQLKRALAQWKTIVSNHIQTTDRAAATNWKLRHASAHAETHEYRIDDEYTVRAHVLLAR
ncbi:hypothetical protein MPSEU_000337400 [Mayamaea pseudoterrestris]|nr:hypothetical protein MPSEU_000337400 [Mayamaea pseudoterrestris]